MLRRSLCRMSTADMQRQRMSTLYKIVTGDTALKNNAPVKDCNITAIFGPTWKTELGQWFEKDYIAGMEAADKKAAQVRLSKYMTRLDLTRYTGAELAVFMAGGAHSVAAYAQAEQVKEAKAFGAAHGAAALKAHVEKEAKMANWTSEQTAAFLAAAK
eukprot:TRINITY_DN47403_c0_g1_i1.p2 TRINITY_DN47403_c0_g1~~TRINITY_DN47403_c0_g1_i1.p2  ORF type:complete len:158 (+),score=82.34 TRINITY_DN47403_c0_g1_i1:64-537(+)